MNVDGGRIIVVATFVDRVGECALWSCLGVYRLRCDGKSDSKE